MIQTIADAIHNELTLRFVYKGSWRAVEPHTYGRTPKAEDALCAWQLEGGSGEGFRLYKVGEISSLTSVSAFHGARPGYHKRDQRFSVIYAEL